MQHVWDILEDRGVFNRLPRVDAEFCRDHVNRLQQARERGDHAQIQELQLELRTFITTLYNNMLEPFQKDEILKFTLDELAALPRYEQSHVIDTLLSSIPLDDKRLSTKDRELLKGYQKALHEGVFSWDYVKQIAEYSQEPMWAEMKLLSEAWSTIRAPKGVLSEELISRLVVLMDKKMTGKQFQSLPPEKQKEAIETVMQENFHMSPQQLQRRVEEGQGAITAEQFAQLSDQDQMDKLQSIRGRLVSRWSKMTLLGEAWHTLMYGSHPPSARMISRIVASSGKKMTMEAFENLKHEKKIEVIESLIQTSLHMSPEQLLERISDAKEQQGIESCDVFMKRMREGVINKEGRTFIANCWQKLGVETQRQYAVQAVERKKVLNDAHHALEDQLILARKKLLQAQKVPPEKETKALQEASDEYAKSEEAFYELAGAPLPGVLGIIGQPFPEGPRFQVLREQLTKLHAQVKKREEELLQVQEKSIQACQKDVKRLESHMWELERGGLRAMTEPQAAVSITTGPTPRKLTYVDNIVAGLIGERNQKRLKASLTEQLEIWLKHGQLEQLKLERQVLEYLIKKMKDAQSKPIYQMVLDMYRERILRLENEPLRPLLQGVFSIHFETSKLADLEKEQLALQQERRDLQEKLVLSGARDEAEQNKMRETFKTLKPQEPDRELGEKIKEYLATLPPTKREEVTVQLQTYDIILDLYADRMKELQELAKPLERLQEVPKK
jgi:hypothetical protein